MKIFGILSAILLLGNVEFYDESQNNNLEAKVKTDDLLTSVASLLELDRDLLANALVKRKMTIKGQDLLIPLKSAEVSFILYYLVFIFYFLLNYYYRRRKIEMQWRRDCMVACSHGW